MKELGGKDTIKVMKVEHPWRCQNSQVSTVTWVVAGLAEYQNFIESERVVQY